MASETGTTYRDAGVNIEEGEAAVRRFKPIVRSTFTPGVLTDIGAFGAFFAPDFGAYTDPVLVSSVDGVGTKLKVAFAAGRHDTVGQDLVNHCVNDIAVCGADPLFFLDYFATGKLDSDVAVKIIEGFAKACRENAVALIGGETAEMPDMYAAGEYDLAGTVVGMVSRDQIIDGSRITEGDILFGAASTGLHTNGFSLARRVLFENHDVHERPPELEGLTVGETLLAVHKSYRDLIRLTRGFCNAFVHVTGGGIPGNTARLLPDGLDVDVDYDSWIRPAIFELIRKEGRVPEDDMRRTFNLGIGLVAVVPPDALSSFRDAAARSGDQVCEIGRVVRRP